MMASNYFQQANQLVREGKLEEAIALYQKAIAQNPKMYLYYHNLGEALEKLDKLDQAVEAYQKALELKPTAAWTHFYLAQILEQQGKQEKAIASSQKATTLNEDLAEQPTKLESKANILKPDLKIVLFTPYYKAKHLERQDELIYCLRKNIECNQIEKIFLLIDDYHVPEFESPKIEIINTSARPTYLDWVELTEKHCRHKISILANTDIYFDESISELREIFSFDKKAFVALSRYEKQGDEQRLHKSPKVSQDVWAVFNQDKFTESFKNQLKIPLGVPRCDSKIAYLFAIHGAKVYNPCYFVKSVHVHETQLRYYDKYGDTSILGGIAYVPPSPSLLECSQLSLELWAMDCSYLKEVKLNNLLEIWTKEREKSLKKH